MITICALDGMVIFATYAGCDLKEQGKITRGDQVKRGGEFISETTFCGSTRLNSFKLTDRKLWFYSQTYELEPPCTAYTNGTTKKFCSIAFI